MTSYRSEWIADDETPNAEDDARRDGAAEAPGERPAAKAEDDRRARVVDTERWRHEAKSEIAAEEAQKAMVLPETPPNRTLEDRLRDNPEPPPFHIEGLVRENHNVVVGALYKTGKTSLAAERAHAEVDGVPFLSHFDTRRLDGNVGFWNNEIEPGDCDDYFRGLGVSNRRRILIEDLKGYRVPLVHDVGAEWAVEWLRSREIESWYLDPWRSICSWSNVNEYLDPEVGPLIARIDQIKREAGVRYVHINHHCGARDVLRPRGATTLPDWADSVWAYFKESENRYLTCGRPSGRPRRGLRPAQRRRPGVRGGLAGRALQGRGPRAAGRLRRGTPRLQDRRGHGGDRRARTTTCAPQPSGRRAARGDRRGPAGLREAALPVRPGPGEARCLSPARHLFFFLSLTTWERKREQQPRSWFTPYVISVRGRAAPRTTTNPGHGRKEERTCRRR